MEPAESGRTGPHYYSDKLKHKLRKLRFAPAAVVEAPSGYGKTTAVRDYLEAGLPKEAPVYWFTAMDEAPAAGFRRFCREIEKIDPSAGERLCKIELPNAATIGEVTDALCSIRCMCNTYLVIDNFHYLHDTLPPAFFAALLEHGVKGLHIIIITRMLKRNMLAAIAGRGFLHISTADLRLSAEDIHSYFCIANAGITLEEAQGIAHYTEGWIIAVYSQLCALQETGAVSGADGILLLMEHLAWDTLTEVQQTFLLSLSPFERVTVQQACALIGCSTLPGYALDALESPFICYKPSERRYELHKILSELLIRKRGERGAAFEQECLMRAGDLCRGEGKTAEAMGFYMQTGDYERMLSLDFSHIILETINNTPFAELAQDIACNCPAEIKGRHILAMLRVAWALYAAGMKEQFDVLMEELHATPDLRENSYLLGEWMLLHSFRSFPRLAGMIAAVKQAAPLFGGRCSQVIRPTIPWCFGSHSPLSEFHAEPGEADQEACALEEYLAVCSRLTRGCGSGADVLFRAELAYHRGDIGEAEILSHKAEFLAESNRQNIVQLGAMLYLAHIALHKGDRTGWQHAVGSMEQAASFASPGTAVSRTTLDIVQGVLFNELENQTGIADWLKKTGFDRRCLLAPVVMNALFVQLSFLMHQGEFAQVIGIGQAVLERGSWGHPFQEALIMLVIAVGYKAVGNCPQAAALVKRAGELLLPDRLIFPLGAYSWLLGETVDEMIREKYPQFLEKFHIIKERFGMGWAALREAICLDELPADLTHREYEVAKLAAEGFHNNEIAHKLNITESTVRAHLRAIFQKLQIDRRAKLAEKLK